MKAIISDFFEDFSKKELTFSIIFVCSLLLNLFINFWIVAFLSYTASSDNFLMEVLVGLYPLIYIILFTFLFFKKTSIKNYSYIRIVFFAFFLSALISLIFMAFFLPIFYRIV